MHLLLLKNDKISDVFDWDCFCAEGSDKIVLFKRVVDIHYKDMKILKMAICQRID